MILKAFKAQIFLCWYLDKSPVGKALAKMTIVAKQRIVFMMLQASFDATDRNISMNAD